MFKRVVAFLLSLVLIFTMLPSMIITAEATEPAKISEAQAVAQLNFLIEEFVNKGTFYFSEENEACANGHAGCNLCNIATVVKQDWFKEKVGRVPDTNSNNYLYHWYTNDLGKNSGKKPLGEACCGFANFAGWYIFSQKSSDEVVFEPLVINDSRAQEEFKYNVLKNARPGDILRLNDGYLETPNDTRNPSDHSAIFISCDKNYVKVLDCNSDIWYSEKGDKRPSGGKNSEIRVHHYEYNDYNYVTISRAENYDVESTQLPAPTINATNVASTGKPKITWTAVPGAEKYQVYQAKSSSGTYSRIYTTTGTTMTNTKAVAGVTYWYKVRAVDADGNLGVFSPVIKRTCDLPMVTNVQCSNVDSTGGIKISWDAVEGADYYGLYRSTAADGTYSRWDGELTKLSYTNVNKTVPGTTYYYRVRAFVNDNAEATSAYSQYASATRKCAQPVLEVDTPNDAATGKPKLSWTAVDGAQKYRVGRADSANGTYNFLEYAEGTTWIDTSAVPGKTYYYKVRAAAENSAGNSAMSAYVKRTCSPSVASLPQITTQPESVTVAEGATAKVTVVATGESLKYQWYYTPNASDSTFYKSSTTTATYSTVMNADRDGRKVYCVVTDKYGNTVKSNTVTLSMSAASLKITTQPKNVTAADGANAKVTVVAEGDGLKYQWYYTLNASGSTFYKSSTTTATYSTVMNADRDGRQVYCVVTDKYGNSVTSNTVTLNMSAAGLKITTQPTNVTVANGATAKTTVVATGDGLKYQWCYTLNASDSTFYKSSTTTATYSTVMNADRDGRQVYCVVTDKYGNSVTSNTVTLSMSAGLKITTQPTNVTVANGATATVKVVAEGDGLKYQWYYTPNASDSTFYKSSTTTATYSTVMNADRAGRQIYCVMTDQYGNSVTSNTVTLSMK